MYTIHNVANYNQTYSLRSFEKRRVAGVLLKVLDLLDSVMDTLENLPCEQMDCPVFDEVVTTASEWMVGIKKKVSSVHKW